MLSLPSLAAVSDSSMLSKSRLLASLSLNQLITKISATPVDLYIESSILSSVQQWDSKERKRRQWLFFFKTFFGCLFFRACFLIFWGVCCYFAPKFQKPKSRKGSLQWHCWSEWIHLATVRSLPFLVEALQESTCWRISFCMIGQCTVDIFGCFSMQKVYVLICVRCMAKFLKN